MRSEMSNVPGAAAPAPAAPGSDSRRGRVLSRKAERAQRATPQPPRPEVPRSAFNFIDEIWRHKQAVRKLNLIVTGVLSAAVVVVLVLGLFLRSANDDARARRAAAELDGSVAQQRISEITGGVVNLPDHIAARRAAIDAALELDIDVAVIVDELLRTAPSGVQITSVSVSVPETPAGADAATTTAAPSSRAQMAAVTATVTGVEEQPGAAYRWRAALAANDLFAAPDVVVGTGGAVTANVTVADPLTVQTRRAEAARQLGE